MGISQNMLAKLLKNEYILAVILIKIYRGLGFALDEMMGILLEK